MTWLALLIFTEFFSRKMLWSLKNITTYFMACVCVWLSRATIFMWHTSHSQKVYMLQVELLAVKYGDNIRASGISYPKGYKEAHIGLWFKRTATCQTQYIWQVMVCVGCANSNKSSFFCNILYIYKGRVAVYIFLSFGWWICATIYVCHAQ